MLRTPLHSVVAIFRRDARPRKPVVIPGRIEDAN
jgi:hypothetical protein